MTDDERLSVQPNIYMERAGKGSQEIAERLLAPPKEPLSDIELVAAVDFEDEICDFPVDSELSLQKMLLTHKSEALEAPAFFAEAFIKGQVHVDGLESVLRQLKTHEDVYTWLAQSALNGDDGINPTKLRDMAKQSSAYYIGESTQALLRDQAPLPAVADHMSIVVDPQKALRYSRAEIAGREYLIELRNQYTSSAGGLDGAKRAFTDIYLKRVNGLIASDIPVMEYLMTQSEMIGDEETLDGAKAVVPRGLLKATETPESRGRLYKRLDYIRNGMGLDAEGHASAVDQEVLQEPSQGVENGEPPVYTLEQRDRLMNVELSAETVRELFTQILHEANLLSSEDASMWAPGRGHRAADKLFQIVTNPTKDGFAVNGVDGVLMIPGAPVSLYRILTVAIHELEHINQNQADQKLGEKLKIGRIKGRRISMLRETGANISQRKAEVELFGVSGPVALTYARAIQAFEHGESIYDATKAFYDEKVRTFSDVGNVSAAKEASDRVLRLILGGGTNSQPMSYAEENIMNEELATASPDVRRRATLITSLDLDDQERLHRFGLLPELENDAVDWLRIVLQKVAPYIQDVLSN
ncbi:MAG: hypothetical protein JWN12_286 [Candidatus Saccharibacteria bacterium]|nr:hypothetical protein [Candidatus Saccharibacteria bacterium]